MTIPIAVSPGTLTPGLFLKVNLISGVASAGIGSLRALLIAPKGVAGTITPDTEIVNGSGEESAGLAYGVGTIGHLVARQIYRSYPGAIVDFACAADAAGAATAIGTITFVGSPASNNEVIIDIHGVIIRVPWLASESISDIGLRVTAAINSQTQYLCVSAVATGGTPTYTVTLSSKVAGVIGNDISVICKLLYGQTGTEVVTPVTATKLTGGVGEPDFTDAKETALGREYHYNVLCLSNPDALDATSSSNVERIISLIEVVNEGKDASLEQIIVASSTTLGAAITAAHARNTGICQHVFCENAASLPSEFAGAEAGGRLAAISIDPAANRIGAMIGYRLAGSRNPTADKPTATETESAIGSGVSIVSYTQAGDLYDVRPVTTYSLLDGTIADRRLLDTQNVDATYIVSRDMRSALIAQFPNAKIQRDSEPGADLPPDGVIEERDIKAFVINRLIAWARFGVILKARLDEAIADGSLIVRVNDQDASQVDIVLPFKIIPPLAKFGLVVNREPV